MSIIRIAIDGPSGAGKSTIAKLLAQKLNMQYIDTGAMYRAVAFQTLSENVETDDTFAIEKMLDDIELRLEGNEIFVNKSNITNEIRSSKISEQASRVSKIKEVREKLVDMQRNMARTQSCVMDGRDIATNVIKDAEYKFYITASAETRAERRYKELIEKGEKISFEEVLKDIKARDYADMHRELNPLTIDKDAKVIDTSNMNIEEVLENLMKIIKK